MVAILERHSGLQGAEVPDVTITVWLINKTFIVTGSLHTDSSHGSRLLLLLLFLMLLLLLQQLLLMLLLLLQQLLLLLLLLMVMM